MQHIKKLFLVSLIALVPLIGYAYERNESTGATIADPEGASVEIVSFERDREDLYHMLKMISDDIDLLFDFDPEMSLFAKHFAICTEFSDLLLKKGNFDEDALEVMVLKKDDKVIGFISYSIDTDTDDQGLIQQIVIDKDHRGKGYATMLMNYAMKALHEQGKLKIRLVVDKKNDPAQKLYKKLGFVVYRDKPKNNHLVLQHDATHAMC